MSISRRSRAGISQSAPKLVARVGHLDGLRAAAALFVVIHHSYAMAYPIHEGIRPEGPSGFFFEWILYGHFGVTVFIVLAGYSLMLGLATKSGELAGGFLGFMTRRAWRIIPPYAAALLVTLVLVSFVIGAETGTHWDQSVPADPKGWLVDAFLLQDVISVQNAAYTFWSISVEWHIYLLLPLMLFIRRRSSWLIAVSVGAGIGLIGMILGLVNERVGRLHPEYYLLFALAAGACLLVANTPAWVHRVPWKTTAALSVATVIGLCTANGYDWATENYSWLDVIVGLAILSLLVSMGIGRATSLAGALSFGPLTRIGAFSYSLYLVHAQLLQVFWQGVILPLDMDRPTQLLVGWLVGVPLIVTTSYLFWLVAERPFVRRATRKSTRTRDELLLTDAPQTHECGAGAPAPLAAPKAGGRPPSCAL